MSKQHYTASTYQAGTSIGYLIKRCYGMLLDILEPAVAAQHFTFIQYVILAYLREGISLNPKDICSEFRHDSGALTRVIDQLVERGLVDRIREVRDRRKVQLRLTQAGLAVVDGLIPTVVDKLNLALGNFSSAEAAEFTRLLFKLNDNMHVILKSAPLAAAAAADPRE